LGLAEPNLFVSGFDRENLSLSVYRGVNKRKFVRDFLEEQRNESGIIYASTRKKVDGLHEYLISLGVAAGRYHAGLSNKERVTAQNDFLFDRISVMVATNAFGMGIDKSNVRYVVHFNMPGNLEAYYQEAGRADRDGLPASCILLFAPGDLYIQKLLLEQSEYQGRRHEVEQDKLQKIVDFCHTSGCLRGFILEYFQGTEQSLTCGNCSNCCDETDIQDISVEAQKVLACVLRTGQRFGVTLIAEVLKGSNTKRVRQFGFQCLSTYGLMKTSTLEQIGDLIKVLTAEGYLNVSEGSLPILKLTEQALPVLKGEKGVSRRIRKQQEVRQVDQLFEQLRSLRRELAAAAGVPPYVIFADNTLRELSSRQPRERDAMLAISGVGEVKFERYGHQFLEIIDGFLKEKPVPPPVPIRGDKPSHHVTLEMLQGGMNLVEIAEARNLVLTTIEGHVLRCSQEGAEIQWEGILEPEEERVVREKLDLLGDVGLKELKDALPEEISYFTIRAALLRKNRHTE